jgi:EAL domain-containing protein (putative c-di-GMP-specific phosphodiesterase class I)
MPLDQVIRAIDFENKRLHGSAAEHGYLRRVVRADSPNQVGGAFRDYRLSSVFQPIVASHLSQLIGHEALVRGESKTGLSLTPSQIFALPQSDHEATFLDRLVRVLHSLNFLMASGPDTGKLFLNVDARLITNVANQHGYFFESILNRCGKSPSDIVLEVVESAVLDDQKLFDAIKSYRAKGFSIAIDDFGSKHSNFDRLWGLEPDIVKLDKSILVRSLHDEKNRKVLTKLIELVQEIGAQVVIEGVESENLYKIALDSGADFLQGFWIARPSGKFVRQKDLGHLSNKLGASSRSEYSKPVLPFTVEPIQKLRA